MLFFVLLGCGQKDSPNTDTQESQTDPDTAAEDTSIEEDTAAVEIVCPELECSVLWNEGGINLTFTTYNEDGSYFFGMAQTGIDNPNVWTGEDCHLGYTTEEETYLYCHPAQDGIELQYGASFHDVIEGYSTHFAGPQFEPQVSYIVKDSISGCCWTWGDNPSYFQELNCIPLTE